MERESFAIVRLCSDAIAYRERDIRNDHLSSFLLASQARHKLVAPRGACAPRNVVPRGGEEVSYGCADVSRPGSAEGDEWNGIVRNRSLTLGYARFPVDG